MRRGVGSGRRCWHYGEREWGTRRAGIRRRKPSIALCGSVRKCGRTVESCSHALISAEWRCRPYAPKRRERRRWYGTALWADLQGWTITTMSTKSRSTCSPLRHTVPQRPRYSRRDQIPPCWRLLLHSAMDHALCERKQRAAGQPATRAPSRERPFFWCRTQYCIAEAAIHSDCTTAQDQTAVHTVYYMYCTISALITTSVKSTAS